MALVGRTGCFITSCVSCFQSGLLDNDELSPDQVNNVKDYFDDYAEHNQEDFDEFSDVDELYISLPLEKVEALEDLVMIPPGLVNVEFSDEMLQDNSYWAKYFSISNSLQSGAKIGYSAKAQEVLGQVRGSEEVSTDIEDLQRIRNKASTDVSKASTDNIHQRISASTDKDFNY
ncbi:hypothetical protein AgCh_028220 [Apium graveolens]